MSSLGERLFDPARWFVHALSAVGQLLSAVAAVTALSFLWYEVSALRREIDERFVLDNRPQLAFSEAPRIELTKRFGTPILRIAVSLVNQGTGTAVSLNVQYVEALPFGLPSDASSARDRRGEDELRKEILNSYQTTVGAFADQLNYIVGRVVTRRNVRVAAGKSYDMIYERPLRGARDAAWGVSADLFCAAFYETESGDKRMTTIWYKIELDPQGGVSITPVHVAFVETGA